jgi:hypothetical protein
MPKEITAYQAKDSSIHDTPCKAATRDVEMCVQASPLNDNQPYAKKLVDWLTGNASELIDVLTEYRDACPQSAQGSSASDSLEGTQR